MSVSFYNIMQYMHTLWLVASKAFMGRLFPFKVLNNFPETHLNSVETSQEHPHIFGTVHEAKSIVTLEVDETISKPFQQRRKHGAVPETWRVSLTGNKGPSPALEKQSHNAIPPP